jgi:PPOX class probable F420-dependent enzyme
MTPDETRVSAYIPIPEKIRPLLNAPNYVHLSTLRADGSPRNHVVWVGLEGDHVLVCTRPQAWKARDMDRDPRVGLSVFDLADPYRMAALEGEVTEVRPDGDYRHMDPIARKYTSAPFPRGGPALACYVIGIQKAYQFTLGWFRHNPRNGK